MSTAKIVIAFAAAALSVIAGATSPSGRAPMRATPRRTLTKKDIADVRATEYSTATIPGDVRWYEYSIGRQMLCGNIPNDTYMYCGGTDNPCQMGFEEITKDESTHTNCNRTFIIEFLQEEVNDDACTGGVCPFFNTTVYGIAAEESPANTFRASATAFTALCPLVCIDNEDICVMDNAHCVRGARGSTRTGATISILYDEVVLEPGEPGEPGSATRRAMTRSIVTYLLAVVPFTVSLRGGGVF